MSLLDRIRAALRREPPPSAPALRNRAGGYAWIKATVGQCGAEVLVGRAVKTVRLMSNGKWLIEPIQTYKATAAILLSDGAVALPGDRVHVHGISGRALEPWKEDGISDSEVRELYQPKPERMTV